MTYIHILESSTKRLIFLQITSPLPSLSSPLFPAEFQHAIFFFFLSHNYRKSIIYHVICLSKKDFSHHLKLSCSSHESDLKLSLKIVPSNSQNRFHRAVALRILYILPENSVLLGVLLKEVQRTYFEYEFPGNPSVSVLMNRAPRKLINSRFLSSLREVLRKNYLDLLLVSFRP